VKKLFSIIIFYIDLLIYKNENYYVFSSYPDLTDNSFALFMYLFKKRNANSKFIWLLGDDLMNKDFYRQMINTNLLTNDIDLQQVFFVKKNSIKGIYWYIRSKYVFFTHGLYTDVRFSKKHILLNLWHGMPLKNIGKLDAKSKVPYSSFVIATSEIFQSLMAKAFDISIEQALISGQPRCDLLFDNQNTLLRLGIVKEQYNKVIFWAPTYRKSIKGDVRCDGVSSLGFPTLLLSEIEEFNSYIVKLNIFLIIKIHPLDILNLKKINSYSNIMIVTNDLLLNKSIQLYNLLGECDILMTDYSSIYIDFLLLDRPIIFVFDDFEKYQNSRGFVFKNVTGWMPGHLAFNSNDLKKILADLLIYELDIFKEQRAQINNLLNEVKKKFSVNLITQLSHLIYPKKQSKSAE